MIEISCQIKYLKTSPRKLRLVASAIKDLSVKEALSYLKFLNKRAAGPMLSALNSVIANALNNLKIDVNDLKIKTIEIGEGPRLKRWQAVSRGTAHPYIKRTSHIKIVLEKIKKGKEL